MSGPVFFKRETTLSYSIFDQELSEKSWKTKKLTVLLVLWGRLLLCMHLFPINELCKTFKSEFFTLENGEFLSPMNLPLSIGKLVAVVT